MIHPVLVRHGVEARWSLEEHALDLYVTGAKEIVWGVALVAITMVLHGLGMIWTLRGVHRLKIALGSHQGLVASLFILVVAAWLITLTHLTEVLAWAGFFHWSGAMPNMSMAYYLALLDYTTLGCDYDLPKDWRLLEGMISIAGLMTFAWSTGVLFSLAQKFQVRELGRVDIHDSGEDDPFTPGRRDPQRQ
jgi:hypothetical protein